MLSSLDCVDDEKEQLNCYVFRDRNNKLMKKNLRDLSPFASPPRRQPVATFRCGRRTATAIFSSSFGFRVCVMILKFILRMNKCFEKKNSYLDSEVDIFLGSATRRYAYWRTRHETAMPARRSFLCTRFSGIPKEKIREGAKKKR